MTPTNWLSNILANHILEAVLAAASKYNNISLEILKSTYGESTGFLIMHLAPGEG